jgi:hypothetical protein
MSHLEGLCSLRLTRRYRASSAEVWRALTDPTSVARWLGDVDVRFRPVETGRVLEIELHDSVARIELSSEGDHTVVVLEHERLLADMGMRYLRLWTNALDRFDGQVVAA